MRNRAFVVRWWFLAVALAAAVVLCGGSAWAQEEVKAEEPAAATESADEAPAGSLTTSYESALEKAAGQTPFGSAVYSIVFKKGFVIKGEKITIAKLLIALFILLIGIRVSQLASKHLHRLTKRFNVPYEQGRFLERLGAIAVIAIFGLVALDLAGIPIGVFAFLGGAFAIAVGFGGQELLANFISGIILMFEKPIRRGDLIQFSGEMGTVEEIGARCTLIRLPGNVDMLVPNKKLIEENLINWTLTNNQVRAEVNLRVGPTVPAETIRTIMLRAANEHQRVDKDPEPVVMLNEFGTPAKKFDLFFWVTADSLLEHLTIVSDVRIAIDGYLREEGIAYAQAQHDVHMDTNTPLEVRVVGNNPPAGS